MTFQESIKTCFSKYADFSGRASRSEYWWFILFYFLASAACSLVSQTVGGLFSLALLLPSLAAGARRLHDTNRSGLWLLIGFLPVIGMIVLIVFLARRAARRTGPEARRRGWRFAC